MSAARASLTRALASPARRRKARALRDRWIDRPLQQLESARRALVAGAVDVLVLGDSSTLTRTPGDEDPALIPELIGRALDLRVHTIQGPGFSSRVHTEMVRILSTLDERPRAVVWSMCMRTNTGIHVTEHPLFGWRRSLAALAQVEDASRPVRCVGRGGVVDGERERAYFLGLNVQTRWGGEQQIADYRAHLEGQGAPPWPPEVERTRFDYFHGEWIRPGNVGLVNMAALRRQLDDYGVPTAVYWTKPPLERGERHFPGEFAEHIGANIEVVKSALWTGPGALLPFVDPDLDDADFDDSQNATEHFRTAGRRKVADGVAAVLRDGL